MIDSPLGNKLVQECRGVILNEDNDWACVSRSFDKFFNYGEGHAASINWDTAVVQEKVDGSICSLYFYDGKWHVATSGTPDAHANVHDTETSFKELFWSTFKKMELPEPHRGTQGTTYIFELTSPYNRIVVRHEGARLTFLGSRVSKGNMIQALPTRNPEYPGVRSFTLQGFDDIISTFEDMDPLDQEGYVIVDGNFNRVKVKHPGYVALHHIKGSFSRRRMVEVVAHTNEIDEIVIAFPEWKEVLEETKRRWEDLVQGLEGVYESIKHLEDQKEFAIMAQQTQVPGALFCLRKGGRGKKAVTNVKDYLRQINIKKLVDLLQVGDINIPGIVEENSGH